MSDTESEDEAPDEDEQIGSILEWIGFEEEDERTNLMEEAFESYTEISSTTATDINNLAKDFSKRDGNNKLVFGMRRTKRLKQLIHWVQDFERCSETPTTEELGAEDFLEALDRAATRAKIREDAELSSELIKAANPGKLKNDQMFTTWWDNYSNYLGMIPGSNGIPLLYIIRKNDEPDRELFPEGENGPEVDFIAKCVACAPLEGPHFEADDRAVHQINQSLMQGESSEEWIKPFRRYASGRRDGQALRDHYAGEGGTTRRQAAAVKLRESLHYKSERAMPFDKFHEKVQHMFRLFEGCNGEEYTSDMKIRFLLDRTVHDKLEATVKALRAQWALHPDSITPTFIGNQIAAAVALLPESQTMRNGRNISGARTDEADQEAPSHGIYSSDGTIYTGYIPHFRSLSKDEKEKVLAERKRSGKVPSKRGGGPSKKEFTDLKRSNAKLTKKLASVNRKVSSIQRKKRKADSDSSDSEEGSVGDDAGNQFGGRAAKTKAKDAKKKKKSS